MAVSTMVGTAKKTMLFGILSLQKFRKHIDEAICKVVNVMEILFL